MTFVRALQTDVVPVCPMLYRPEAYAELCLVCSGMNGWIWRGVGLSRQIMECIISLLFVFGGS